MVGIDAYIYIVISLLGVAYPLLLQVIARLDEKYDSDRIVFLFDKELEGKFFRYSLMSSLILIVIWSLKIQPFCQIDGINFLIDNSAKILVASSTIALVIIFFFFVNKILIYYTPSKFIKYLISKHNKISKHHNSDNEFIYFESLADILLQSIKRQNKTHALKLSQFFNSAFYLEREKNKNKPTSYPEIYYEVVYKLIEELAVLKEKRNYPLEYRTGGSVWLLGELTDSYVSNQTYAWLWRNLRLAIHYLQEDMIVSHWENAHKFYSLSLPYIYEHPTYSSEIFQVKNSEEVNNRKLQRERFIEFHYALGGLLLYKKMYTCMKRIFNHTHSEPPKYELLPETMDEIFKFYYEVIDPYDRTFSWISSQYSFPDQSGLNSDGVVKQYISSYMALLFLRQYTLIPYLTTMKPLEYPRIPESQVEKKEWIDGLDYFKELVSEHLENTEIINKLNLNFLTRQWCLENNKPYPLDFIDNFKENLVSNYEEKSLTLQISEEKVSQFNQSTKTILEKTLGEYQLINNPDKIEGESDKWYVGGQKMLQSKEVFSDDSNTHHFNFDSILASIISSNIKEGFASTFLLKKSKSYLLKSEDIFPSIDKLEINEKYVLIFFGFNLDYFINQMNISNLTNNKYKDIDIISVNGTRFNYSTIFILKKADLPVVSTRSISKEIIQKYSLKDISDNLNLYTSVIDLNNTTDEIFQENNKDGKEENEIKKSLLLSVVISTEILWKKNINIINITQYSQYENNGLPNSLREITPFGK